MEMNFVIPPVAHMELAKYNGYKALYCLAHLCLVEKNVNYKRYINFFKGKATKGYHVILDNSAAEADLVTEDVLIELTKEIMPTEVIAPDHLYDEIATVKSTAAFIQRMREEDLIGKVQIHAVPQGNNPESYLRCYLNFLYKPGIDVIGLSKLSVPESFKYITDSNNVSVNRRYLIKFLHDNKLLRKPIHCLGMRSITEFYAYKGIPYIRSTDSCYTVLAAAMSKKLDINTIDESTMPTPHDYFFWKLDRYNIIRAKKNIDALKFIIESTK